MSDNQKSDSLAVKLMIAFDLMEFSIELERQNIKRKHPEASKANVDKMLQEWINTSDNIHTEQ